MSMTFTLICHCGAEGEWTGETFTEIRDKATGLGWDIKEPLCPAHARPRQP